MLLNQMNKVKMLEYDYLPIDLEGRIRIIICQPTKFKLNKS